jgi:DNA-binding NarL/FixJ family response regulator
MIIDIGETGWVMSSAGEGRGGKRGNSISELRSARSPATLVLGQAPGSQHALTPRQREALKHVSEGLCVKEIAAVMGISAAGAKKHVDALRRLYVASNNAQLIRRAFESGDLMADLPRND